MSPLLAALVALGMAWLPANPQPDPTTDWPTFRGDTARSGRSTARVDPARWEQAWRHDCIQRPRPAWPGPARWDAFAGMADLKPMRQYDPVFHVVAVGDRVWFGSSSEDTVTCLDASTGGMLWVHHAGGPVRIAPHVTDGRLYFGADDGSANCLDAETGALIWSTSPTEGSRKVLQDGRLISRWPVRTGVLVEDGVAYFAASMLPWKQSWLCAVDALTGELREDGAPGRPTWIRSLDAGLTLEGALLSTHDRLIVPQGRVPPLLFERDTGELLGSLEGGGGSFCLLTDDDRVLHGPGNKQGWITDSEAGSATKLASYEHGHAIVVDGEVSYLLSDRGIVALDRERRSVLWSVRNDAPLTLIQAGGSLVCGGDGHVLARAVDDGRLRWKADVAGRAYGLALAGGRLFVSTDEGVIHAFEPGEIARPAPIDASAGPEALPTAPTIKAVPDRALLDRWVFQEDAVIRHDRHGDGEPGTFVANQTRTLHARALGVPEIIAAGPWHALELDGVSNDLLVTESLEQAALPKRALTVCAWVRLDAPAEWGGLIGAMQDNGDFERGWLLGYRGARFAFALASEESVGEAADRITWITAPTASVAGAWHHVAGSYDGRRMSLYVDGEEVAASEGQRGNVRYPSQAFYHLAAYRDDDEHFRCKGALHELRLYERALSAREVAALAAEKAGTFPEPVPPEPEPVYAELATGPMLRWLPDGQAQVTWTTHDAVPTRLAMEHATLGNGVARTEHRVLLDGLRPRSLLHYRIGVGADWTRRFECDTHLDVHDPPVGPVSPRSLYADLMPLEFVPDPRDMLGENADEIEGLADALADRVRGRHVVVLGNAAGISLLLADRGARHVTIVTTSESFAESARPKLLALGLGGARVSVILVPDEGPLPLPRAFADVVLARNVDLVSRGGLDLVRPYGGVVVLETAWGAQPAPSFEDVGGDDSGRWRFWSRIAPADAGVWTHMYGLPDNSAYGGEALNGARSTADLELQWIGRPGARHQSDRQNRKPAPLALDGRLFVQGLHRITCLDAYNGGLLWGMEMPELARFNVPRSTSNWCVDQRDVLLAVGARVVALDVRDGSERTVHALPAAVGDGHQWGWIARVDQGGASLLLGSAVRAGSQFTEWWGGAAWYDAREGDLAGKVCSTALFARDARDGALLWTRPSQGLVIDATLCAADGRVTFVEARDASLRGRDSGRIADAALWSDLVLVSIDVLTGQTLWEREAKPMPGSVSFCMAQGEGSLALLSSNEGSFALYVFDASDGRSLWRRKFDWEADHHGKHLSRPAIAEGRVFVRPMTFALDGGEVLASAFPEGHQCGSYAASKHALFLRAGELAVWDVEAGNSSRWSRLRPDCWISTIPACGVLLSPEGGGGCSCGSWIQASMGFLPRGPRTVGGDSGR